MYDICCIGHITLDKIIHHKTVVEMAGGTSFYFSNAISHMPINYLLVTALAESEQYIVNGLQQNGIEVTILPSRHTVYFENSYSGNQDHRTQRVFQKADPFTADQLFTVQSEIFHLGPLLADDISVDLIRRLAAKGVVSLDVQGYLREVRNQEVCAIDWPDKKLALQYITVLKANEYEMEVLTGERNVRKAARLLFDWGVKEVIITLGSRGSVIYDGTNFYDIPAYLPNSVIDGTGCGDTYMAGYLYQRIKGAGIQERGEFAAAMATLNIQSSGPFMGSETLVNQLFAENRKKRFLID